MQDWQAVRSSIAKSKEEMDGLDGVAVCIGSLLLKPAHLTSQKEWNDVMHTHVSTAFGILGAAACAMMRTGGSIVLTASAASRIGMANHAARSHCCCQQLQEVSNHGTPPTLSSDANRKASQGNAHAAMAWLLE